MATHVWLKQRLRERNLRRGLELFQICYQAGLDLEHACTLVGCVWETTNQSGGWSDDHENEDRISILHRRIASPRKKYLQCKNTWNFQIAGEFMLEQIYWRWSYQGDVTTGPLVPPSSLQGKWDVLISENVFDVRNYKPHADLRLGTPAQVEIIQNHRNRMLKKGGE